MWGLARHLNYLGEGFYSLAGALAFGYFLNPWAWIYFIYVLALFTWRQRDDDRLCAEKYGAKKWAEYQEQGEVSDYSGDLLRGMGYWRILLECLGQVTTLLEREELRRD